ncbi:DUF1587 domain-containing protein, partial [Candidatus Sumerlaeota bacterium]|nr:DUF1587 domain-containing protein [Candidatus Sumerlaeota bacterium]
MRHRALWKFKSKVFERAIPICMALAAARKGGADEPPPSFIKDIQPLVTQYCVKCHSSEKKSGGVDFSRFDTDDAALAAVELWKRAGVRLSAKEMPPKLSDQPSDAERQKLVGWIGSLKDVQPDCGQLPSDENMKFYRGYVMSRRMNRAEYSNTVRDLLGVELDFEDFFPRDGSGGEGFDNNGDALFTSAIQVEKYLDAADRAVNAALPEEEEGFFRNAGRMPARLA